MSVMSVMKNGVPRALFELVAPDCGQRRHDLREIFNAMRSIVRTGAAWRWLPTNFPPWEAVYQQTRCSPRRRVV